MYSFDYLNQNGVSFNNVYLRRKRQGREHIIIKHIISILYQTYYYQNEFFFVLYHPCTLRTFKKGRTLRTLCRVPYVLLIIGYHALNDLAVHNSVNLCWVKGHDEIWGNEK